MTAVALIAAALAAVLALNMAVDPLWYLAGNRLTHVNYMFDEREGKTNLFLRAMARYDCVIFGASSSTLLHEDEIVGHRCFNFSVSAGTIAEFVDYAKFARAKGFDPRLVIVAIDDLSLVNDYPTSTPDFVKRDGDPPPLVKAYLSKDVFWESVKTVFGRVRGGRYYRPDFVCEFMADRPVYHPSTQLPEDAEDLVYSGGNLPLFQTLHDVFPHAQWIGYAPLRSSWITAAMQSRGRLDPLLRAIYPVTRIFDAFYDFSVPSPATEKTDDTYDGYHFSPAANKQIAVAISGGPNGDGLAVSGMSWDAYRAAYGRAVAGFDARHGIAAMNR